MSTREVEAWGSVWGKLFGKLLGERRGESVNAPVVGKRLFVYHELLLSLIAYYISLFVTSS